MKQTKTANKALTLWLATVCILIFVMITVGGVTRLTDSGLSMVDWQPLLGWLPPLTNSVWQATFARYQQFPEYQQVNMGMSLDGFKAIYYWEYAHRLLGRLIGLAYALPLVYFWVKGHVKGVLRLKLIVALILGALQGLMGWYMVQSGLVNVPSVSHYRLAAHLLLALLIMGFLFWVMLGLLMKNTSAKPFSGSTNRQGPLARLSLGLTALLVLQITYGAFTAGLHAGWGYNSFPDMNGQLLPDAALHFSPVWRNLFENPVMVQFIHRVMGTLTLVLGLALLARALTHSADGRDAKLMTGTYLLTICILLQYLLGVYVLLNAVPLAAAVLHQAMACVVLLLSLWVMHRCFWPGHQYH